MEDFRSAGSLAAGFGRTPLKGIVLAVLMTILLGGALPLCFLLFGSLAWLFWGLTLGILLLFALEMPVWRLLPPLAPYLAWLCFYLIWGLIVSPYTDWMFALKTLGTTLILGLSLAIMTARPQHLRTLASVAQFAVVGNLVVLFFMVRYPGFATLVDSVSLDAGRFEVGVSRFSGLWGNPNMAGYVCVVVTILSVFARPWIGWLGRLACPPLLYLTASRKSVILYLVICLLYLLVVQRRNLKFWALAATAAAGLVIVFSLSSGLQATSQAAARDVHISRLLDIQEKVGAESGNGTRLDLFKDWMGKVAVEPWYGYGLQAMAGTMVDPVNPNNVLRYGVFPVGTHNTYLGVWVDIGPIGLLAFLAMLLYYAKTSLAAHGPPLFRWALVSFLVVNLVILVVSHSHLFSFEGKYAFLLFFLLPSCQGLRDWSRSPFPAG